MSLLSNIAISIFSFLGLIIGSEWVINSAEKLSKLTKLGELVLGFLLISILTNIPELSIAITSTLNKSPSISFGNLIGSSITNIALILGIVSIISPIVIKKIKTFKKLSTILFLVSIIPIILLLFQSSFRFIGVLLLLTYFVFMYFSLQERITLEIKKERSKNLLERIFKSLDIYKQLLILIFSMFIVFFSSYFLVNSIKFLSNQFKISDLIVGATFLGLGTSLPELTISIKAAFKKKNNLIMGGLIGACLTNLTLILGILLIFNPLKVNFTIYSSVLFFLIISTLTFFYFLTHRKISKFKGLLLIFIYFIFFLTENLI